MAFQGFNHQSGPAFPRNSHGFSGNFSQSPNPSNPLKRQIAPQQQSQRDLTINRALLFPETATAFLEISPNPSNPLKKQIVPQQQSQRLSAHTNLVFDNEIFKAPEREMSSTLLPESTSSAGKHNSPIKAAQGISHVSPYRGQRDAETDFPVNRATLPVTKRLRSPPLQSSNDVSLRSPSLSVDNPGRLRSRTNLLSDNVNYEISKRTRSPSSAFGNYLSDKDFNHRPEEAQGSALSPSRWGNWPNSDSASNLQAHQSSPPSAPHVDIPDSGSRFLTQSAKFNVPKRMRSPPLPSPTEVSLLNSHLTRSEAEREIEAKAKRLARFNVELSLPIEDLNKKKDLRNTQNQLAVEKQMKYPRVPPGETGESLNGNILGDVGGLEPSTVVVGLCQDMCPESERVERERKGDLDKYERLDGDRNQTTKYLAVKKYNRTAEREADLIRPMPVLQNTIGYLLGLLNQPYDSEFLGIYNFLWDRMRAIRMDLRMQHLFNEDAITMLEQMIRLHIIAMHELCEFTKGEGFMEGFDAHLNIEQMNKASVELFQMYDDHRKKGTSVPTEKEFRGYYALLKLDKHPGYKVEPGELSLDLAKMTPEIRGAPDVLFARDVARACRTGNFIAFFRLARKASYLQACLMHAHFAKLRTQALASLHSGLQNNQGIPVPQVVNWLGMEEEDIESFLEYHGFSIKKFDFSYMVKEGSFLNSDKDYPNKCSKLVHLKKSETIIVDVSSIQITPSLPSKGRKTLKKLDSFDQKPARFIETETLVNVADEEMADFEDVSAPGLDNHLVNATIEVPYSIAQQHETDLPAHKPSEGYFSLGKTGRVAGAFADNNNNNNNNNTPMNGFTSNKRLFSSPGKVPQSASQMLSQVESPVSPLVPQSSLQGPLLIKTSGRSSHDMVVMESDFPQKNVIGHVQDVMLVHQKDEEAVSAKLRLILRIWKRRSAKQRELREQHQLAAGAALNLLSLGPPLQQYKEERVHTCELDIDHVRKERLDRLGKSRSRINVAEVVGPILSERNPQAKCLCWKLLICSQANDMERDGTTNYLARKWLFAKLMATAKVDDDELVLSSPGLSVWKRLILNRVGKPQTCCLSVIREVPLQGIGYVEKDTTFVGASSILFLLSDHLPWDLQRVRLLNVLSALPCGSNLPLLVCVSGVLEEGIPDPSVTVANRLGLYNLDKTRISSFTVVFLSGEVPQEHLNVVLTDNCLREGLRWLATQSPLQPVLREVKTRELVMSCLATSLEELVEMEISKVGPNHCISTFNMALDSSAKEIIAAADVNPTGWPCPEIELLQNSTFEQRAVSSFLPRIGWSSAAGIESTVGRIKACKLPPFADDVSWLNQGCDRGQEIRHQKEALEKCLIWYLTDKIMPLEMAEREAVLMLNKGAVLELNGLKYRIVPRWVMIFRRIYNWQLENLIGGEFSSAYILNGQSRPGSEPSQAKATTTPFKCGRMEEFDATRGTSPEYRDSLALSNYVLTKPSLDEMLEVGFKHQPIRGGTAPASDACQPSPPNALQPSLGQAQGGSESMEITLNNSNVDGENLRHGLLDESGDIHSSDGNSSVVNKVEEDRFSNLLAQCNLLQDRIAKKLAIYY